MNIHADFRCKPLQPNLLTCFNRDDRNIVDTRRLGVENCIGLCHTQGRQDTVLEPGQNVAHPQVQLAVVGDHAVDVIGQLTQLAHGAKIFGSDIVGIILLAVELGGEGDRSIAVQHQINRQTAIRQIEMVGNTVAGCCGSGLGVLGNHNGLNGNGLFLSNGTVDGQSGIAAGIGAARTKHQHAGCQVLIRHIALGNKLGSAFHTSVDGAIRKQSVLLNLLLFQLLIAAGVGEDLLAGGSVQRLLASIQILQFLRHITLCIPNDIGVVPCLRISTDTVFGPTILDATILCEDMIRHIGEPVQIPFTVYGVVVQGLTLFQAELTLSFHHSGSAVFLNCLGLGVNKGCIFFLDGFLFTAGQKRVRHLCRRFLSLCFGGNGLQVVAVTLAYDGHTGIVKNFSFLFSRRCIHRSHLIGRVSVLENDLTSFIFVTLRAFFDHLIDDLLRNQANLTIRNLCHNAVDTVQHIAVGG